MFEITDEIIAALPPAPDELGAAAQPLVAVPPTLARHQAFGVDDSMPAVIGQRAHVVGEDVRCRGDVGANITRDGDMLIPDVAGRHAVRDAEIWRRNKAEGQEITGAGPEYGSVAYGGAAVTDEVREAVYPAQHADDE